MAQGELTPARLLQLLAQLDSRQQLLNMARAARALARPEASESVARVCVEVMK